MPRCAPSCSPSWPGSPGAGPTSFRWGGGPTGRCSTRPWWRWAGARTRRWGSAGDGWWRWRCSSAPSGCSAGASATSERGPKSCCAVHLLRCGPLLSSSRTPVRSGERASRALQLNLLATFFGSPLVVEPARLTREALRPLHAAAAPAPRLGDAPPAHLAHAEVAPGVAHPVAAGTAGPRREVVGRARAAAVLHHQGQGGGEAHLPPGVDVHGLACRGAGANQVHSAEEGLLFDQRAGAAVAFHGAHPIRED